MIYYALIEFSVLVGVIIMLLLLKTINVMANTYFKLVKSEETKGFDKYPGYTNDYNLTLTAYVCKTVNCIQLTVRCDSTLPNQSGIGYITLSVEEQDKLIAGILERRHGISATSDEQSDICPNED